MEDENTIVNNNTNNVLRNEDSEIDIDIPIDIDISYNGEME